MGHVLKTRRMRRLAAGCLHRGIDAMDIQMLTGQLSAIHGSSQALDLAESTRCYHSLQPVQKASAGKKHRTWVKMGWMMHLIW